MGPEHEPNLGWIEQIFGRGELPPPRFSMELHRDAPIGLREIEWTVRGFELQERIGEPYALALHVRASTVDVEHHALLGVRVELTVSRGSKSRVVCGVVLGVSYGGSHGEGALLTLEVGPAIALLGLYRRSRVFQDLSVPQVVERVVGPVLGERGGALSTERLTGTYAPRDYCVQYRETDLAFVLRLLANEGIGLLFHHDEGSETVVLIDGNEALPAAGTDPLDAADRGASPLIPLWTGRADEAPVESLHGARQQVTTVRRGWSSVAHDWMDRPPTRLRTAMHHDGSGPYGEWSDVDEHRCGEGQGTNGPLVDDTARRVSRLAQRDDVEALVLHATSNATALRPGSVFELVTDGDDYGEAWVVTSIQHCGHVPSAGVHGVGDARAPEYGNTIECQPLSKPVRPPMRPGPRVLGVHTAAVTGPEGEAIHTDRFGRIRVRLLWDDAPHDGEETSCWLRVAQPWAGDGFGTVFIPRVGSEVLVTFVDGDPDRPLCTGSVYNGGAMPPYALPEHRSRTALRTASLDGEGHNELSFEDGEGREEVYLYAQRDLREKVRASQRTSVGGARRLSVGGPRTTQIGKDDELKVKGAHRQTVDGDVALHYHSGMRLEVSAAPGPEGGTGAEISVKRGKYVLDVAEAIELRCGQCSLTISPTEITLAGPIVRAESTDEPTRRRATLDLRGRAVELRSDQVLLDTGSSSLHLADRVVLGQGPADSPAASLDMQDGTARLRGKAEATITASRVRVDATKLGEVAAADLRLTSSTMLAKTNQGDLNLVSAGECRVRAPRIRLN